jgi:osomolarity two-component system sensor histidine kinase SLN1
MRIGIREQLAILVFATAVVPLAMLATATWINNHQFVINVTSKSLTLTASLKASQIASDLTLIQSTCSGIVSRVLIQEAIKSYYRGNSTSNNWTTASNDVQGALATGGSLAALLQVIVFSRNSTGNPGGLFNVTDPSIEIRLPSSEPNGTAVYLGDPGLGYPATLYPNITYTPTSSPDPADPSINETVASAFADFPLNSTSYLFLGPLQINEACILSFLPFDEEICVYRCSLNLTVLSHTH